MSKFREIFRGKPKYVTVKSGVERETQKKEASDAYWIKCTGKDCGTPLYQKQLAKNLYVCEKCGQHHRVSAEERIAQIVDDVDHFVRYDQNLAPGNPLGFPDYEDKLKQDYEKTGLRDAIITGEGLVGGYPVVLIVMEFAFRSGSMGSVVGEKITRAFERATEQKRPVIAFSASGGARMQEGIFSLIQMQKTAMAVSHHSKAGQLFISVLTDPTLAGVFGSFASLGDVIIAEPGATIGFAGLRVIEEAIRRPVPTGLQQAETVYNNGFIDMIVPRTQMKNLLVKLLRLHGYQPVSETNRAETVEQ
jgi:acetyl-CoA carboxylase carboxyl transferase subunit beta